MVARVSSQVRGEKLVEKVLQAAVEELAAKRALKRGELPRGSGAKTILDPLFAVVTDIHLWSNTVIPASSVLLTAAVLGRFVFVRSARAPASAVSALIAAAAGGWLGATVTGAVLFPSSMPLAPRT